MTSPRFDIELRRRADLPPAGPRIPLFWRGQRIGSVDLTLAEALRGRPGLTARADALELAAPLDATLDGLARWLRDEGRAGKWRDELLAVNDDAGTVHGRIERAAVRPLGITTQAVHLVGLSADGRVWVQQRAIDKATDPGLWDTLVGGLVSADETLASSLERETWEEAGLRPADLGELRSHGSVWVRRPVPEGYMVERLHVHSAVLRDGALPVNQDGEVQGFDCVDLGTLRNGLAGGAYTLEAALVLLQAIPSLAGG